MDERALGSAQFMNGQECFDIGRMAMQTTLKMIGPVLAVSLAVGVAASLVQGLTQIQETALSFIPKVIAVFVTLLLAMPLMAHWLHVYTQEIFLRMASVS